MLEREVETRPWPEQVSRRHLLSRSARLPLRAPAFYREKLAAAGIDSAEAAGGLADIARLPLTEKAELRATVTAEEPMGTHLCAAPWASSSGSTRRAERPVRRATSRSPRETSTTGPGSARSYAASGSQLDSGSCRPTTRVRSSPAPRSPPSSACLSHVPVATGNTERLVQAIELLKPEAAVLTPAVRRLSPRVGRRARPRRLELERPARARRRRAGRRRAAFRARLDRPGTRPSRRRWAWARSASRSGASARSRDGMHFGARGFVHAELVDPSTGAAIAIDMRPASSR